MTPIVRLDLSGDRFSVVYRIRGDETEARYKAGEICLQRSVEFPADLVPEGDIRDHIMGRIESLAPMDGPYWEARISYAVETTGFELLQLMNVALGNTSFETGVRVERLEDLPDSLLRRFKGPRFGREGLRELLGVPDRPLIGASLKPMGLPPAEMAEQAYRMALGGIDIITDDYMLTDQPFCPFRERVARCADAVRRANRLTGCPSIYTPNVTGPVAGIVERAMFAREAGAGGLFVCPGLVVGLDTMRQLADDDRIGLPIIEHPTFQGTYLAGGDSGLTQYALLGQIGRLSGADAILCANYGGRFASFGEQECRNMIAGCAAPMGPIRPVFPMPGGGMLLERIPEMAVFYNCEAILVVSGGLHSAGPDLVANCRHFRKMAEQSVQPRAGAWSI